MLPDDEAIVQIRGRHGLKVASYFEPSSTLSGDIWGMATLDNSRLAVYIIDFSGHGIHAALNIFRMHTLLAQYGSLLEDPASYLSGLNGELVKLLSNGQFATMLYGIIDTSKDTFTYSAAAAPHPLIALPHREGLIVGESAGLPLGIVEDATYELRQIEFGPGAALFLYSDALTETCDRNGKRMGTEGLKERVTDHLANRSPVDLLQTIVADFLGAMKGPLPDDLTAISIYRGT